MTTEKRPRTVVANRQDGGQNALEGLGWLPDDDEARIRRIQARPLPQRVPEARNVPMIGLRFLLRRLIRRAAQHTVAGRLVQRDRPERGRFLPSEVDAILAQAWRNLDEMLPEDGASERSGSAT